MSTTQPDLPMAGIESETLVERAQRVYGIELVLSPCNGCDNDPDEAEPDWLAITLFGRQSGEARGYTPEDAVRALCVRLGLAWPPPKERGAR